MKELLKHWQQRLRGERLKKAPMPASVTAITARVSLPASEAPSEGVFSVADSPAAITASAVSSLEN
jgi:hypothetical protein